MVGIWGVLMFVVGLGVGVLGAWLAWMGVSVPSSGLAYAYGIDRGIALAVGLIILSLGGILSMLGALGIGWASAQERVRSSASPS